MMKHPKDFMIKQPGILSLAFGSVPCVGKDADTAGIKRCGRCKVVGYYGKGHQKADWKVHKKIFIHKDA